MGGRCPNLTTTGARSVCISLSAFFAMSVFALLGCRGADQRGSVGDGIRSFMRRRGTRLPCTSGGCPSMHLSIFQLESCMGGGLGRTGPMDFVGTTDVTSRCLTLANMGSIFNQTGKGLRINEITCKWDKYPSYSMVLKASKMSRHLTSLVTNTTNGWQWSYEY